MNAAKRRRPVKKSTAAPTATAVVTPTATAVARQRLRRFAAFIETQNADALAAEVTRVHETLHRSAIIQSFFRRYVAALRARVDK